MTEGRAKETKTAAGRAPADPGDRPWVSLEDRGGAPALEALRAREMVDPPPVTALQGAPREPGHGAGESGREAGDPGTATSRRDFAKLLGLGLAAAGCSRAPVREAVPFVDKPVEMTPGAALHYATTCAGCAAACPLVVKTRDGRAIKVEGNRLAVATGGGTCAVGQATVLGLYDDTRFRGPRWRGEKTSWDELDRRIREHIEAARAAGGRVAVVTGTLVSPTTRALLGEWVEHHDARWVTWDPMSETSFRRAHEAVFGAPVSPSLRLDRARAVLGLEADFLGTGAAPVEHARGYAEARRLPQQVEEPTGEHIRERVGENDPLWHGQIESRMSLTGANADWRMPVDVSRVGDVAVALWHRLQHRAGRGDAKAPGLGEDLAEDPAETLADGLAEALDRVADRLWRNRGASLVVCGLADPAVQQVVCGINLLLESYGRTLDLERPSHRLQGDEEDLDRLLEEMNRGEIHVLLLWGVNPVYHHPRRRELVAGLDRVALTVSFAGRPDETTELVDGVAPDHHFLESWNDAEPVAGRLQLAQPTQAPLFDTRAAQASLLAWMGREPDWRSYLERRWRQEVFPLQDRWTDPDVFWHQVVHDGILQDGIVQDGAVPEEARAHRSVVEAVWTSAGELAVSRAAEAVRTEGDRRRRERSRRDPAPADGSFDLVLYEKVGLRDGRWAHLPWLQELPDPISRVTWGNYLALAPAAAERLGVAEGDVVRLELASTEEAEAPPLELPVQIQPGQAPGTVAVALGYGRRSTGSAADGVGGDASPWIDSSRGPFRYHRSGVRVTATGRRQDLAATQHHHLLEGRPFVRETSLAAWYRDPGSAHPEHHGSGHHGSGHGASPEHGDAGHGDRQHGGHGPSVPPSLWEERPELGHSWGMAIDLHACIGCGACVVACQAENNVPVVGAEEVERGREMHWLRIDRYYRGSPERPETVFQPMMCQHCDHAPCETVCPVLATVHSSDGLNQQVYNRCVGTRYCANNCPYKVRRFNWFNYAGNDSFDYHLNSELGAMVLNPDVTVRTRGVMEKCSLCIQRIQGGKLTAREEGRRVRDGDVQTACQQACPSQALTFGDWLDPESRLSQLGQDPRFYRVLDDLGVRPSSGYLARVRHREGEGRSPSGPSSAPTSGKEA